MNNTWLLARMIGAIELNKAYTQRLKECPESYYYLNLVVISEQELDILLYGVDISEITDHLAKLNNEFK